MSFVYDVNKTENKFVVIAYDNGEPSLTSTATVNIILTRVNTETPQFVQSAYNVSIDEYSPAGTEVVNVQATFSASDVFGPVRYLLDDSSGDHFTINHISGQITVLDGTTLSRSIYVSIPLIVTAFNNGSDVTQRKSAYATVTVYLIPKNAHYPTFTESSYLSRIAETSPAGQYITTVLATDPDYGVYGVVGYDILSSNDNGLFGINNNTGTITATKALIGHTGTYNLIVKAYDHGSPALSSTANVTVIVYKIDTAPAWRNPAVDSDIVQIFENVPTVH
jgi:hypothetical protein